MSQAVTMSTAPPMQPPWMAAMTGIRAFSRAVKLSCKSMADSRSRARARPSSAGALGVLPSSPPSVPRLPPVNTARSMPAEKCLPVEEITMARARPSALMPLTMAGSSIQNSGIIEFSLSGRLSWMWATWSLSVTSKQVYPMRSPRKTGRAER